MSSNYDQKGNATHYSDNRINMIRMLEQIWGTEVTMKFCEMNAFKYRMRLGKKDDPKLELVKIHWYEAMAAFLRLKIQDINIVNGLPNGDSGMFEGFDEFLKNYSHE